MIFFSFLNCSKAKSINLVVILENPAWEQHSSLELSFIYGYLSWSLESKAE